MCANKCLACRVWYYRATLHTQPQRRFLLCITTVKEGDYCLVKKVEIVFKAIGQITEKIANMKEKSTLDKELKRNLTFAKRKSIA